MPPVGGCVVPDIPESAYNTVAQHAAPAEEGRAAAAVAQRMSAWHAGQPRRVVLAIVALTLLIPAGVSRAEVFRCGDDGAPLFSDRRCAADSEALKVKPAAGRYDQLDDLQARIRTARGEAELRRIESERDANRLTAARVVEAERIAGAKRCDEIRDKLRAAESQAEAARRPDKVQRESAKAKRWKDRLWWECKAID